MTGFEALAWQGMKLLLLAVVILWVVSKVR